MKCPKCNSERFAYKEKRIKATPEQRQKGTAPKRTNFTAECKKCGYVGKEK